jgi:type I restriction enzyme S subunit
MKWTKTKLGEFAPFVYGKGLPQAKRIEGEIPVYGSNGIVGTHSEAFVKEPAVIIGRKGSVGEVHLSKGQSWPIDTAFFALGSKNTDLNFLYYLLKTLPITSNSDSAVPGLNRDFAHSLEIRVPEIRGQIVIGEILANLDSKISANENLSRTLEGIAQTIFKSWFIDFDPVKAKMAGEMPVGMDAATSALFPDSMEESELGLIPKGWRVGSLGEIADLQGGYAFKSSSWTESGVPVIKIGSVKPGFVDLTQVSYVDAPTAEAIPDDYRIPAGSLVVGLTGYVGQVGLMRTHDPIPLINQRVAKFKLKSGDWKIPFIYCFTRGEKFKGIVEELATGTAQQNVSNSQILSIPMAIPSEHIREMFDNSFKPFFQDIINLADENESLKSTRDALLPRLISGELPIPEEMLAS